jgi:hypothetical protein
MLRAISYTGAPPTSLSAVVRGGSKITGTTLELWSLLRCRPHPTAARPVLLPVLGARQLIERHSHAQLYGGSTSRPLGGSVHPRLALFSPIAGQCTVLSARFSGTIRAPCGFRTCCQTTAVSLVPFLCRCCHVDAVGFATVSIGSPPRLTHQPLQLAQSLQLVEETAPLPPWCNRWGLRAAVTLTSGTTLSECGWVQLPAEAHSTLNNVRAKCDFTRQILSGCVAGLLVTPRKARLLTH